MNLADAKAYNAKQDSNGHVYNLLVCGFMPPAMAAAYLGPGGAGSDAFAEATVQAQVLCGIVADGQLGPTTADSLHKAALKTLPPSHVTPHFTDKKWKQHSNGMGSGDGKPVPPELLVNFRRNCRNAEVVVKDIFGGAAPDVVSGHRSPEFNKKCGGEANSLHMQAMASDLRILGHVASQAECDEWMARYDALVKCGKLPVGGAHGYKTKKDPFLHTDGRGYKARWKD